MVCLSEIKLNTTRGISMRVCREGEGRGDLLLKKRKREEEEGGW